MQDFSDFDSSLRDQSSQAQKRNPRSGTEPIPEFDRAVTVMLEIEVLKETYDEILGAIIANEWEREEGLRTVLLSGLGYLDAKLNLDGINRQAILDGESEAAGRVDSMIKELAAYHSMYSVMKFKAFKLYKTNQALEFNIAGLRETERMWEGWADRMRREHTALQGECIRLRALMSEFKLDWDQPTAGMFDVAPQPEEPAITTPLLARILPDGVGETLVVPPYEPMRSKPSMWERFRSFLRGG